MQLKYSPKAGDGVIYLNIGLKHANHLAVSLMTLRDHYKGPVCILSGGEQSMDFMREFVLPEERFHPLTVKEFEVTGRAYFAKTSMGDLSPFDRTVFIDSDTIIVGEFLDMFPVNDEEVRLTWFADWMSNTGKTPGRIKRWEKFLLKQVSLQLAVGYPAINTGVVGFSKGSHRFMERWKSETAKQPSAFMADELTAQLIFLEYPHCLLDERWNASPKFTFLRDGQKQEIIDDVRIIHGHGFSFVKERKRGRSHWLPRYFRARHENWARIDEWTCGKGVKMGGGVYDIPKPPCNYVEGLEEKFEEWRTTCV